MQISDKWNEYCSIIFVTKKIKLEMIEKKKVGKLSHVEIPNIFEILIRSKIIF